ncbi:hypothetical protein [Pontibacter beigongshangensis]|uniref:hypothetical protein n=1 Tax=Pontibacter beigongshangensis TaxID=2574733 RepID=UPI00164F7BF4|nr:hypothetical protein [Pontibacter beigongshangensis]
MDRRDREHYDRHDYGPDYDRYEGYDRTDDHYHSARNLTDTFERDYQRERGYTDDNRLHRNRSYHEGSMDNDYGDYKRENRGYQGQYGGSHTDPDRSRNYSGNHGRDRYPEQGRLNRETDWYRQDRDRSRDYGSTPRRYASGDRYDASNRNQSRGDGGRQDFYTRDSDRHSRYNDETYDGGTSYSGRYGTNEGNRYGSGRSNRHDDSWLDAERRGRDY